jgi:Arc/MetJ family transcription regulator
MQELIQQIVQRAGISEESATAAVAALMDYVKQRAPAPIAAQLEQYLTGDAAASAVGAAKGALGGMFGRREPE